MLPVSRRNNITNRGNRRQQWHRRSNARLAFFGPNWIRWTKCLEVPIGACYLWHAIQFWSDVFLGHVKVAAFVNAVLPFGCECAQDFCVLVTDDRTSAHLDIFSSPHHLCLSESQCNGTSHFLLQFCDDVWQFTFVNCPKKSHGHVGWVDLFPFMCLAWHNDCAIVQFPRRSCHWMMRGTVLERGGKMEKINGQK